jgi:dihydrofolate reductase
MTFGVKERVDFVLPGNQTAFMRRIIFSMFVTLDGFFEGPEGPGDLAFHVADDEHDAYALKLLQSVDAILFGRVTYQGMAEFWPTPAAAAFAITPLMNALPKIVFSTTLQRVDWQNSLLVTSGMVDEVKTLKAAPGKDLLIMGSAGLATSVMNAGLMDEFHLLVSPVFTGRGKPLFGGLQAQHPVKRVETRTRKSGVLELTYQRVA